MVLREAGRPAKALEHLTEYESLMHDKLIVREVKGIVELSVCLPLFTSAVFGI